MLGLADLKVLGVRGLDCLEFVFWGFGGFWGHEGFGVEGLGLGCSPLY